MKQAICNKCGLMSEGGAGCSHASCGGIFISTHVTIGSTFTKHDKFKFEGGYHEFDLECVVTSIDRFQATYKVTRLFNEVNKPSWQKSDMTVTGGGFNLLYNDIVNGKLIKRHPKGKETL